ncbi:aminopeptidase N [Aureimonas phyllosphaerae]|uniref:Aminopeptidase N n=1 Tax=Aureimonas phyllosphaerae TaxID=1166078 RepID=A0A7W6BQS3_9HYPH|nr:aminopeptidase N [Aureimonas phyllosphaerae]MBB3934520.1 aminopeptidase N [Aureimonas phyllosphaerae]MBB3958264.1 aminopeptidase N [Aureimonas phyllosphaerae]SFE94426.1 aminopeptidase N [Aureimonas phyllosphaerae]
MQRTDDGQVIRLSDYRPPAFRIRHVDMRFSLNDGHTDVETVMEMERAPDTDAAEPLVLDGDALTLIALDCNGVAIGAERFEATPDRLTIRDLPPSGPFTLRIATRLTPETNTELMGLYRSNGVWCTQCEAEGFRRITYFLDRPDVLATYRVRIEADREAAPILLSNGNPGEHGDLDGGRHYAVWDDPHPKPSYLFALVAGRLDVLTDTFETQSGRDVDLAIYTEPGLADRAAYAMDALKRSMVWDERRFGREYDLDVFNIVAISDFNMGAMENKGLNVFNHKYVLLAPDTATDGDYAGVETVIAHEYFHNWTGNRITCRDWFQLCLKEGLTVYRDQEFSADERSRTVKRIGSVHGLKAQQFPEDQGPLQHPVRPRQYREINNFYTATVYEKGSELVRMLATILGEAGFRAGMDLYFARHDGDAATIEDFLTCFAEATGTDLSQFALWYDQAGTPELYVTEHFEAGRLTLSLRQSLARGAAGTGIEPMHIPVRFGLVGPDGTDLAAEPTAGTAEVEGDVIHLVTAEAEVVFSELAERPRVSILRDFSAPVTLRHEQAYEDRLVLARLDPNGFGRWRALTDLVGEALRAASMAGAGRPALDPRLIEAVVACAAEERLEPALRALMIALPGEAEIARLVGSNVDPEAIHQAREGAIGAVATAGAETFRRVRDGLERSSGNFSPDAASAGRRALSNALLMYLSAADGTPALAAEAFRAADNMTDRMAAATILAHRFAETPEASEALDRFYADYAHDPLVLDKWFTLRATVPSDATLDTVRDLAAHPKFSMANPNRARALIGGFATGNPRVFHQKDGAGYRWTAERLGELDRLNPQTAARLATAFRSWRSFEPVRQEQARAALSALASRPELSRDLRDILDRTLS